MNRMVVVYDEGAVGPDEISAGLTPLGEVIFALPPSAHNTRLAPLLAELGEVVPFEDITTLTRLRPAAVLTFSERRLRLTAALTEALGLPGHTPATAELLTDKLAQRGRLRATGVDPTRSAVLRDSDDWAAAVHAVGLPAVLKPVTGEGSRNTYPVHDAASGERLVAELIGRSGEPYTLEEYLTGRDRGPYGDYVSVENAVTDSRVVPLAVTGKFPLLSPFRERGQYWPARLDRTETQHLTELAERAVRALGVRTGVTHTEIKLTPHGPRVIEVNGRLGGLLNQLSLHSVGVNLVELAGRVALGEPVTALPVADAVHFQHFSLSPTQECRFLDVRGISEVRHAPGITGYRRLMPPGTPLASSTASRRIDHLWGQAPDHERMRTVLNAALAALTYVYDMDGAVVEIPANAV